MSEEEYSVSDNDSPIDGECVQFHQGNIKKTSRQTNEKPKTYKKIPVAPTKKEDVQLLPILRKKNKHTKPKKT